MPRVGVDGSGSAEKTEEKSAFGGWFEDATRAMKGGNTGGGYVVLGATRYGLRLSQESLPQSNSLGNLHERRRKRTPATTREPSTLTNTTYTSGDSRERLTTISNNSPTQQTIESSSNLTDCCCIGPRSRLPLPKTNQLETENHQSNFHSKTTSFLRGVHSMISTSNHVVPPGIKPQTLPPTQPPPPPPFPPPPQHSNSINNKSTGGGVFSRTMDDGGTSQANRRRNHHHHHHHRRDHHHQQPMVQSTTEILATVVASPSPSSSASVVHSVSVPRQFAQWTKHQTLRLQEPTVTAVDRLHRFRWSGGGGGSGKKSSSSPRSDKAERLRELTEKLKGPAPVPPPRRPSRVSPSTPPPPPPPLPPAFDNHSQSNIFYDETGGQGLGNNNNNNNNHHHRHHHHHHQYNQQAYHGHPRIIAKSESVSEECLSESMGNEPVRKSCHDDSRKTSSRSSAVSNVRNSVDISDVQSASESKDNITNGNNANETDKGIKHLRQYSDSIVLDGAKCHVSTSPCVGNNETEARDAITRLEPRGPLIVFQKVSSTPYRSASFGQADFNQGNREKIQPNYSSTNRIDGRDVRASTLPRRRGDMGMDSQNNPKRESPRTSTPSVDSAVGSAEGLGIHQNLNANLEEIRPRSDGSDSLTTSSALTSPEPPINEIHSIPNNQQDSLLLETVTNEQQTIDSGNVETIIQKENRIEPHEVIITPPPEEPRLSQASEASEALSETPSETPSPHNGKTRRYRGDTSKRRKGVYITQWPEPLDVDRNKLSAQSSEERDEPPATPSDLSDCEGHTPRRYSKRPLRGPYGQMLEAEMAKPRTTDIALEETLRPRRKVSANLSYNPGSNSGSEPPTPCHHRTTSSPSKLEGLPGPSPELLAELLRGSSERVARAPAHRNDTRTHVVVELYDTEKSYVEALQILVNKYLQPLKSPDNAGLVDSATVDEIFYQIPAILVHHQVFLDKLRKRLDTWEIQQTIGDVFLNVFTKSVVLETYTLFLDNWKSARKAIKTTCQAKPAFARFIETMEREHKGKLGLDQLLIKPVQKIPRYELLIQRLLKHTDVSHPDYELLQAAQKEIHELVVKINCTERESFEWEQQQSTLREVQALVEGLAGIVANDRAFIRHDLVTMTSNQGTRKERAFFLFTDLLVITSIKRRSGTIKKPSTSSCPNSLVGLLEANKYKMLMRISLDDLEVMKAKDENLRRMAKEVDHLREDCATLSQLQDLTSSLHSSKQQLEELIKDMLNQVQRQLAERNAAHSQLACLELTLNTHSVMENISVMFTKPDKRASWEESFNEAKQKLALSADRRPCPEFVGPLPIRKTRAGLQFTCAAPTLSNGQGSRDVWVCNSDGYVGQVCVLSLTPEPPQVTSCNGVCNARILCVAGIPASTPGSSLGQPNNTSFINCKTGISISVQDVDASGGNIQLDSGSSSEDSDSDDIPCTETGSVTLSSDVPSIDTVEEDFNQPTMWLGTEDGCVHVYNCNDNIRIKKNKVKIPHGSSVHCIIYLDNKVFVSLANGDITVYVRDPAGGWNTPDPTTVSVATVASPVTKMISVSGKIWCGCHNSIKVLNTKTLDIEHTFTISGDTNRAISSMASSSGLGVWISLHNSAVLRLFHAISYECLTDINIAPAVTKMLASCDDIIRQHKAACLRVTALLACNELLWIGTSAGVLLTVPIPHIKPSAQRLSQPPIVTGIPHGHTGHVRFLTCVETTTPSTPITKTDSRTSKTNRYSSKSNKAQQENVVNRDKTLVISGGDGYEDFRGPQASAELQAGREDSTNHLLLWKV